MIFNLTLSTNLFIIFSFVFSFALALREFYKLKRIEFKNAEKEVVEISNIIKQASITYLFVQFRILILVESVLAFLLYKFLNPHMAIGFVIGAILSWICGFFAMYVSVIFNYKVTLFAKQSFNDAFNASFSVGKIVSLFVNAIALAVCFIIYRYARFDYKILSSMLIGLSFGASLISIFARIGGGIFTKGADIGADLVGKIENNLPEDDPRNPAVIADCLGDNVGDCAGMSADLFETFVVIVSSALSLIHYIILPEFYSIYCNIVFVILSSGLFASILTLLTGWNYNKDAKFASLGIAMKSFAIGFIVLANVFGYLFWGLNDAALIFECAILGILSAALILPLTEYYTSKNFKPVKKIVEASSQGHANNIIQGIAVGFEAAFVTVLFIISNVTVSYYLLGTLGIAFSCLGMISICSVILALDAFGPITDNAGGLAEMGKLDKSVREITDELDSIGNMTKATTKGYAVYSAGLAAFVLATLYNYDVFEALKQNIAINLFDFYTLIGLFLGAAVISIFSAICMTAVNKSSMAIMEEVRNQFKNNPGILAGTSKPDYTKAIDILTTTSLKQMMYPALLPVFTTIILFFSVGILSGVVKAFVSLAGFIIGSTITGVIIATFMTVSGGAWDNAKKYIESINQKGSFAHQAAVTGDTVGDPFKDTAGPSINPMIKLIAIISILITMIR